MKIQVGVLALSLMGWSGMVSAEKINMKPGLWKSKIHMTSSAFKIPATESENCMTEADLENRLLPEMPGQKCKQDLKVDSKSAVISIDCTGNGMKTKGQVRIDYTLVTYKLKGRMSMSGNGMPKQVITIKGTSKRIGDCKK